MSLCVPHVFRYLQRTMVQDFPEPEQQAVVGAEIPQSHLSSYTQNSLEHKRYAACNVLEQWPISFSVKGQGAVFKVL